MVTGSRRERKERKHLALITKILVRGFLVKNRKQWSILIAQSSYYHHCETLFELNCNQKLS